MYIVTRTFRDANGVFGVGSVVDPTSVKAFKSRLQQRHIIDVNEANVEFWRDFLANRYGIDLDVILRSQAEQEEADAIMAEIMAASEEPAPNESPSEEPVVEEAPLNDW